MKPIYNGVENRKGAYQFRQKNHRINSLTLLDAYRRLGCRECEVLDLMAEGKSSSEIAKVLHISKSTVENHITTIGKKLKLSGRGKVRKWLKSTLIEL